MVNIPLPPLRERPSDIVRLAQFFADKFSESNDLERKSISKEAQEKLKSCKWRGNIRELENTMHRAILMSNENEIESGAIFIQGDEISAPSPLTNSQNRTSGEKQDTNIQNTSGVESFIGRKISDVEREMILNTLDQCLGNRTHAANILGISIRTLRNKLNQYKNDGINIPAAGQS